MKTILIVDDNEAAADGLARLLRALGYDAAALYSGQELLDSRRLTEADIAFIDIGMPGMDGYEVAAELRAKGVAIPLIALSGYGQQEDIDKALAAGFSAHLTKPVGVDDLRAMLERLL